MSFLKYAISIVFCNFYRLLKLFPNNDPIMGFALPFARRDKWWQAVLFPAIAMASFDFITMRIGIWTIGTAAAYGFVGLLFYKHFKEKKKVGLKSYAKSSVAGVLVFDFLTGPIMSSYAFKMPLMAAFIGQVPFTLLHLASGLAFTLMLAPVLDPDVRATVHQETARFAHNAKLLLSQYFWEA